jgi:GDP/UDP-N,N'-diacetylbacillosamine 2-epimerase (hydrolysing)
MRIGVLTSSRADYSIYLPLLRRLKGDSFFEVEVIVFGTHLSPSHGMTVDAIAADGFENLIRVDTHIESEHPRDLSKAMAKTLSAFADLWSSVRFDLVFCLGDRYEMFSACAASVPFNIPLAHIHGGERTEGAIDEVFRHSITHMSQLHFASTELYKERILELKGKDALAYNVGALSYDNLKSLELLSKEEFKSRFGIDLNLPTILITFHPETVGYSNNVSHMDELVSALGETGDYRLVITMPNADTTGQMVRRRWMDFAAGSDRVHLIESFGTIGYLSCMKHCSFMLGNTSSGFLEAGFFPKYVVNIGSRQKGRIVTENIMSCPIEKAAILAAIEGFSSFSPASAERVYGDGNAAGRMVDVIKGLYA